MSESVGTPGQPGQQPTGPAAGTPAPVQQAPAPAPTATPPQGTQPPAEDWHKRYTGLQAVHQATVEEVKGLKAQLEQFQTHSGTLEQQLQAINAQLATVQQTSVQQQERLAAAQLEGQFWNLISTKYPNLMSVAPYIQRLADPAQQEALLQQMSATLGAQVQQATALQTQALLQGVTPAATPQPGGGAPEYDRGDVYTKLLEHRPGTPEYAKWKGVWNQLTAEDPKKLHPSWRDPIASDWETIEGNESYLEPPKTEPGPQPTFLVGGMQPAPKGTG